MARIELKLPRMGESILEATLISWKKNVGDTIKEDDVVVEVATDKVDNEVVSEVEGKLVERRFSEDEVIKVGDVYAIVETTQSKSVPTPVKTKRKEEPIVLKQKDQSTPSTIDVVEKKTNKRPTEKQVKPTSPIPDTFGGDIGASYFYSPLVRTIMVNENILPSELERIERTGRNGRLTKDDLLRYLEHRKVNDIKESKTTAQKEVPLKTKDQVIEMDRVRKLIANHMVESLKTSAHVQSIVEADITNVVKWRDRVKSNFQQKFGEKLTYTPILMDCIVRALKDYPIINSHVSGDKIILKKQINIGMATALENGNLIVPVLKNAENLDVVGLAKEVNKLAKKARENSLTHDDTFGGTYTVSNIGNFGTLIGTPIINQPQVGIIALGAIKKVPAVLESSFGDFIGIRHKMFLSHSYDHRVIDGALGGLFVKKVADYIEQWDIDKTV